MEFSVSVIIPVLNGEQFIEKAVLSALQQVEVAEVIVVNDGSKDATASILSNLKTFDNRIKVYQHEGEINKGRSASRNLAIKKAKGNFIAFLDADDFYLENRFENDKKIFSEDENIEGIYNAIGVHFYRNATAAEKEELKLTTVTESIEPSVLFEALLSGRKGYFSIDGLIVKKTVFKKTGFFSENLVVTEDTELILKMAAKSILVSGIINKAVTLRGVHHDNSFSNDILYKIDRIKMYDGLLRWCFFEKLPMSRIVLVLDLLWYYRIFYKKSLGEDIFYWLFLAVHYPKLLTFRSFIKDFPLIRRRKLFINKIIKNK